MARVGGDLNMGATPLCYEYVQGHRKPRKSCGLELRSHLSQPRRAMLRRKDARRKKTHGDVASRLRCGAVSVHHSVHMHTGTKCKCGVLTRMRLERSARKTFMIGVSYCNDKLRRMDSTWNRLNPGDTAGQPSGVDSVKSSTPQERTHAQHISLSDLPYMACWAEN